MERYRIAPAVGVYSPALAPGASVVTFTVVEWLPVFIDETACQIITASLNYCHAHKALRIHASVIMLNHLHAILFDADFDSTRLKRTLDDFRKFTGRQLLDLCAQYRPTSFMEEFRKHAGKDRERRFWQPTQHPEGITSEKFYVQKLNYIHDNPRRKGLVKNAQDWRFSSAAYSFGLEKENDVVLSALVWE